ncbi:MAG: Holliday junction resolvase RuvX [Bacteroidetes bacterium]|jgi:putative holliday junction resolvase|nr:Holliday junction resolvase RuvX [Bacteroidota bacterium]MDA0879815.1 Holliday junction resolvase RuvX [Bacteroidota bacterium]MDA1115803.1 Holliday junction resolvase RuvX [Bacteroidota bacterium]
MPRILAIDYGLKRSGIAITDPLRLIASGLTTVETSKLILFLSEYFAKEEVDLIVVGLPKQMDNSASESEPAILKFIESLDRNFVGLKVVRYDERFTSKMASQAMISGGVKKSKRREKGMLDKISATLILQGFMESLN